MRRYAAFLKKFKLPIAILLILVVVLSAVGLYFVITGDNLESDLITYIGDGYDTNTGLSFLNENFNVKGDIMFVVEGEDNDRELYDDIQSIAEKDGVQELVWYGSLAEMNEVKSTAEGLLSLFGISFDSMFDASDLEAYLKRPTDNGTYNYIVLMLIDYESSSKEAFALLDTVEQQMGSRNAAYAGMTLTARRIMYDTLEESVIYAVLAICGMLIALLMTSRSLIEVIAMPVTVAVAVLINLASFWFFDSVSVVSFAVSALIQLTVTADASFFFTAAYKRERAKGKSLTLAMSGTRMDVLRLLVCGLSTALAFCGLFNMRFGLGDDIAFAVVKGVLVSIAVTFTVLPLIYAVFEKADIKTTYVKRAERHCPKFAGSVIKYRGLVAALILAVSLASVSALSDINYSFFKVFDDEKANSSQEEIAKELTNQLIIAVPVETICGSQTDFVEEFDSLESVDKVLGAFSAVKLDDEDVLWFLDNTGIGNLRYVRSLFRRDSQGKWYTLCSVILNGDADDMGTGEAYDEVVNVMQKYFGEDCYRFGLMSGVADLEADVNKDMTLIFLAVTLVALFAATCINRSLKQGLLTALICFLSFAVNIAVFVLSGADNNFIYYLLISAVQFGSAFTYCTIMCGEYGRGRRAGLDAKTAATAALSKSLIPIISAYAVLFASCIGACLYTSNLIAASLTRGLITGNFIGCLLAVTLLPAMLSFGKTNVANKFNCAEKQTK